MTSPSPLAETDRPTPPAASQSSSASTLAGMPAPPPRAIETAPAVAARAGTTTPRPGANPTAERVRAAVREGADEVAARLSEGLKAASTALATPSGVDLKDLLSSARLPDIVRDDVVSAMVQRVDREGAFWRNFALRSLIRAEWADRVAQVVAIVAALGGMALAVVAGLGALFAGGTGTERAALVLAGALAIAAGAGAVVWIAVTIRRAHREAAREAMARADAAEARLHRLGIVLALRRNDEGAFAEALARLERDAASAVK